jgi:hypothetical protein
MSVKYRYSLEKGSKKHLCPNCGKKSLKRYIDNSTGEYLPEQYGRCNHENSCVPHYHLNPKAMQEQGNGSRLELPKSRKPELSIAISHCINSAPIETESKLFTEINVFNATKAGILNHISLSELSLRLNEYKRKQDNKNQNPAILKGLYLDGTAGEFCEVTAPFLFFDIDVKEHENQILFNLSNRNAVFEYLKKISVLVWLSNSQKGIAGILYTPQLVEVSKSQTERHLTVSKKIYSYLSDLILKHTALKIDFDYQQGKFRQVRYLAEQSEHREINFYPLQFDFAEQNQFGEFSPIAANAEQVFFDFDTFKKTLAPERYEKNIFIQNLLTSVPFPFEPVDVIKVIELYRLGTVVNGYRAGAVTFPFINIIGNVRAVQVKQFDEQNHTTGTDFLHSIIEKHLSRNNEPMPEWLDAYIKQDKFISCLYGEHLLSKYPKAYVYLFEAPKTAIYSTMYFGHPEKSNIICLAVYSKSSFSFDKLKVLRGRIVFVFPDLSINGNAFREWEAKAQNFEKQLQGTRFIFSDLLEQLAPERDKVDGKDIADYLIQQDWRKYRNSAPHLAPPKVTHQHSILYTHAEPERKNSAIQLLVEVGKFEQPTPFQYFVEPEQPKPECWKQEIVELENYFKSIELPTQPVMLNPHSTIKDCSLFIKSHIATAKANNGKRVFLPYLNRLQELKQILSR